MEEFVKGDIVVVPFPFSDLSANKRRPAFVAAKGEYGDLVLCQITSKLKKNSSSIELSDKDFQQGSLKITSYIRPRKIFTSDLGLVLYKAGRVKKEKIKEIGTIICKIMKE